jgi:PAS domain S-box-containing protein
MTNKLHKINVQQNPPIGFVNTDAQTRDFSLRKAAQNIQNTSEELEEVLDLAHMGLWEYDLASQLFTFSKQYLEIVGLEVKDQAQMSLEEWFATFVAPESLELLQSEFWEVMSTTNPHFKKEIEYSLLHAKSRKSIWVNSIVQVKFNKDQQLVKLKGVLRDITERKNREALLAKKASRAKKYSEVLYELSSIDFDTIADLGDFYRDITQKITNILEIGRASIWIYNRGEQELYQAYLYDSQPDSQAVPQVLDAQMHEAYFKALKSKFLLVINDVSSEKSLQSLLEPYYKKLGIKATLQIPILLKGQIRGYIFAECRSTDRLWEMEEVSFVQSMANCMTSAWDAQERVRIQEELRQKNEALAANEEKLKNNIERLKAVQSHLVAVQERFDLAIKGANDGIWDWDLQNNEVYFSPNWKRMLGYEPLHLKSTLEVFQDLLHPEDRAKVMQQVEAYIKGDSDKYSIEMRMRRADGSYAWILSRGAAIRNEQGIAIRLAGSHTDISQDIAYEEELRAKNDELAASEEEIRQSMDALTASQEELMENLEELRVVQEELARKSQQIEALINASTDNILMVDEKHRIVLLNETTKVSYASRGLEIKEGMSLFNFVEESQKTFERANLQRAFMGESFKVETEYKFPGFNAYYELTYFPVRNAHKEITYVGLMVRDITARKNQEIELLTKNEALAKSEARMREILEAQIEINERLVMAERKMKNALEAEQARQSELNEALNRLKNTQTQLVHNEKMASLGQLTAGIAHEINNPINYVYNGIDTLKMTIEDLLQILQQYESIESRPDWKEALEEVKKLKAKLKYDLLLEEIQSLPADIKKGAIRTIEIVKGLRIFSRLDEEEKKKANLHDCLDSTIVLLKSKMKNKAVLHKYYDNSLPEINCYPGQLNQVFMNILNNAIQAIPADSKEGKIEIYTEQTPAQVVIRIKDNGVGMNEQVRKRIFEPFFTTKDVGVGTGLGLSISFGIIEKHQGTIEVHSQEGKGTEFVISLPTNLV